MLLTLRAERPPKETEPKKGHPGICSPADSPSCTEKMGATLLLISHFLYLLRSQINGDPISHMNARQRIPSKRQAATSSVESEPFADV